MNLDSPCLCPRCHTPMMVSLPIWVQPGEDVDIGDIDWESSNPKDSDNWWCCVCESHHFPMDNEEASE